MFGGIPARLAQVVDTARVPVHIVFTRMMPAARVALTSGPQAVGGPIRLQHTATIKRPAAEVFAAVANPETYPHWSPSVPRVQKLTAGPLGVGTRFQAMAPGFGQGELEISEYEKPTRVLIRAGTAVVDGTHLFLLRPEGDDTRVEQVARMKLKGPVVIMTPIALMWLAWTLHGDTERLKAYLARQAPRGRTDHGLPQ